MARHCIIDTSDDMFVYHGMLLEAFQSETRVYMGMRY